MDEKTTEDHARWCPRCSSWAPESELRVPADGKPRHKACGTITLRKTNLVGGVPQTGMIPELQGPIPELQELAGRMAADEAGEGNFGAAAELKAFAEGGTALVGDAHQILNRPDLVGTAIHGISAGETGTVQLGGSPTPRIAEELYQELRRGLETVERAGYRVPEPPMVSRAAVEQALAEDLCHLDRVQRDAWSSEDTIRAAQALVELGWVPGARRLAAELPKATAEQAPEPLRSRLTELADPDRYEEQPIEDADGAVIGHVWELQARYCLEHEREWVAAVDGDSSNRPRFGSRDGAEGWVRANALRDGRPLTVPYDAEKVLGLKSEVIGWVWLDPEHAGEDGRWLAVHGAAPEHQHPNWGSPDPGPDARNQAIGWVLEQDKAARRG